MQSVFSAWGFTGGKALLTNGAVNVSTIPGRVIGVDTDVNGTGHTCYLLFYNALASAVTVGTTVPFKIVAVPNGASFSRTFIENLLFSTALSVAMVMTTVTGTTAPSTPFGVDIEYV